MNPDWLLHKDDFDEWMYEWAHEVGVFSKESGELFADFCRFPELPMSTCPKCGSFDSHYEIHLKDRKSRYKCKGCRSQYTTTQYTWLHDSKLGVEYWWRLSYLLGRLRVSINSHSLSRDLGVTQATAYKMLIVIKKSFGIDKKGLDFKIPFSANEHTIMEKLLTTNTLNETK